MAIDQATATFLQTLSEGASDSDAPTLDDVRAIMASLTQLYGDGPAMTSVTDHTAGSEGARFPVRVLVPTDNPRGIVVYYHGGGWVLGSINEYDTLGREIAARANVTVVLVGYRLAPEHPFPAAVDDAWAALNWVAEKAADLPGSQGGLIVAGDSAGGNLAIVTALHARTDGPRIDAAFLAYPSTDADHTRPSYQDPENQLFLTAEDVRWFLQEYLGSGDPSDPRISPLREENLAGFPPTVLAIAEHDPLKDEGEAFGSRLREAGVTVKERLFTGQMHGFFQLVNVLPASIDAVDWFAQSIDEGFIPAKEAQQ